MLHKRAYKVLSRMTVTKEVREVVDGVEQAVTKTNLKYGTGKCWNCGEKDTNQHAFIPCPEVRRIWEEGTEILWQLLGWYRGTRNLEISVCEVVLAFPKLGEDLPKQARARVVLWHSAMIYAITTYRERNIQEKEKAKEQAGEIQFDFGGCLRIVKAQIRHNLWDIWEGKGDEGGFISSWVEGNDIIRYHNGRLEFV